MVDMKTLTIGGTKFEIVDAEARADISSLQAAVGSPLVASTVSAMTDHNKVYVYTGSESGYTNGNWYYWNGSAWTSGGVYNAVAVSTDKTLSVEGMAADAKKTGDEIADLNSAVSDLEEEIASGGLTVAQKSMLMSLFRHALYSNNVSDIIDALENSFDGIVPATGITLSENSLSFTSRASKVLIATVTPSDSSDVVVWGTSDGSIATVSNGTVTPVSDGNCQITATAGNYSATCVVSVALPALVDDITVNGSVMTIYGLANIPTAQNSVLKVL